MLEIDNKQYEYEIEKDLNNKDNYEESTLLFYNSPEVYDKTIIQHCNDEFFETMSNASSKNNDSEIENNDNDRDLELNDVQSHNNSHSNFNKDEDTITNTSSSASSNSRRPYVHSKGKAPQPPTMETFNCNESPCNTTKVTNYKAKETTI